MFGEPIVPITELPTLVPPGDNSGAWKYLCKDVSTSLSYGFRPLVLLSVSIYAPLETVKPALVAPAGLLNDNRSKTVNPEH